MPSMIRVINHERRKQRRNHLPIKDPVFIEGNEDDPVSELRLMAA
jgi:hypothetical protein